jgi:inhibitor of KinA
MKPSAVENAFPRLRPVADAGVLVEFGEQIADAVHAEVIAFDAALQREPFCGFVESIPTYAAVFVGYDPVAVTYAEVATRIAALIRRPAPERRSPRDHEILACYEEPFAPDLGVVADRTGLTPEAVIAAHLAGRYRVFMYGFAPGYAYLGGVPPEIRLPRKQGPVRGVAAGSVIIAGSQCLVTTLTMPTGWWIIGKSPTRILRPEASEPFLFDVGDRVRFLRVDAAAFAALSGDAGRTS